MTKDNWNGIIRTNYERIPIERREKRRIKWRIRERGKDE